jgi:hypothetical protein
MTIEQEIAAARAAEDLKRRGELFAGDRDTMLIGLDALAAQAARSRVEEARERSAQPPATYPGEPGSLADIGRRRFLEDGLAYRERLHPEPDERERAYRARLIAESERA